MSRWNGNLLLNLVFNLTELSALTSSEYLQLTSPFCHDHVAVDMGTDCFSQPCAEPLEGERPVSLVSTLSSGSSRESQSLFGSTVALPSSSTPPIPNGEDIDLELIPAEQARDHSPVPADPRIYWLDQHNKTPSNRKSSREIPHSAASPVVTEAMAPNPKLTYVDRVVMEIIETERTYVRDLRSIVEDYLSHIIDTSNLPIRPEQVCALFGNVEDIYEFNSELLQSLDMCDSDPVAIAQCFVDKSEYFEIYTQYCTNYPNSVAALTDCMRSKTLAKFFRDRQAALKRSLPLGSYLLKPVQRILKYHLLLQEIARHYDPDEEGYEVIQEAIDTMTGVAWYINDMKRRHEHAVRVQEIQSLLINWKGPDLTTYGELVLEGTFHVLRAKNTRTLFLFQRMLLITKRRGEHYVYKTHISCATLMLLDSGKDPLLFSVIHFKHPKQPHTVQAKSVEEKRLWAHHIKRLILENHNAIVPPKAKEATLDNSNYPGKHHSSPEKLKRTESCQAEDFHGTGRNGRRRSEPVKQVIRSTKAVLKVRAPHTHTHSLTHTHTHTLASVWAAPSSLLSFGLLGLSFGEIRIDSACDNHPHLCDLMPQHADSEGALLGDRRSLQPTARVGTLAPGFGPPRCVEDQTPGGDSPEQPRAADPDRHSASEPQRTEESKDEEEEEGGSFKEDILMGDDQVADFASSVLAAISCWHYRARALLSTHFTTADLEAKQEADAAHQEETQALEESLSTQVFVEEGGRPPESSAADEASPCRASPVPSTCTEQPVALEPANTEAADDDEEVEEGGSDSSGVQVEETSALTNGELSEEEEEEEEALSDRKSILPSSVLDQASVIAEHFISNLSRRSSLVSEDTSSLVCSSPLPLQDTSEVFKSPTVTSEHEATVAADVAAEVPALLQEQAAVDGERRSTLSKQDRLLIHKIRRYYEHAEDQDANFSIKRRESLSYIPAGLVRHLSHQLNSISDVVEEPAVAVGRKGTVRNRPTSWSVFDLPGLGTSIKAEPDQEKVEEAKTRSPSVTDSSTTDEEFRPSAEMIKVWQDMEEEEGQQAQLETEDVSLNSSNVSQEPSTNVEESETSATSDGSSVSSPTANSSGGDVCKSPATTPDPQGFRAHLPKIIQFRTSVDEDQILQDMGKMKNKVFQLARQYSQRIKNNRPMVWQKSREAASQLRRMDAVEEEKTPSRKKGRPPLRLPLNACSPAVIQEVNSPGPLQSPGSGPSSHCTAASPQSPQSETFHWPDVQELRSRYTPSSPGTPDRCPSSNEMLERSLNRCNSCSRRRSSSSDLHRDFIDKENCGVEQDWPKARSKSLLCRWSSLDHMLLSNEAQNLQDPLRTCQTALIPTETNKLHPGENLFPQDLDCSSKPSLQSPGKMAQSHLVKSLREKFQSLSTS
ncbi:pleckstrin homology domain-containing family G member 3-like [Synchiropus picturatus]